MFKFLGEIMRWIQVVKILLKHAKNITKKLKEEGSSEDKDSPNVLTKEEIAITITEELLESVASLTPLFTKK